MPNNWRSSLMRNVIVGLFLVLPAFAMAAKPYGHYDVGKVLTASGSHNGQSPSKTINLVLLDKIMDDLEAHAHNYPPHFESSKNKERATRDVKALSKIFDILLKRPSANKTKKKLELVYAAMINNLAYNLDVPGAGKKADELYKQLLSLEPSNARANYEFGLFLASSGHAKEALPHLKIAVSGGITEAYYGMGWTYLELHKNRQALKCFEAYEHGHPDGQVAVKIIDAIREGKVQYKTSGG